jgi:hypothetical protein
MWATPGVVEGSATAKPMRRHAVRDRDATLVCAAAIRFTTRVSDNNIPAASTNPENPTKLTDDELIDRLHDHRRGSGEWAAVLGEIQRRADREAGNARFRDALASADDGLEPSADT